MTVEVRATALRWRAEGRPAVVVTVLASRGSVPREAGTRMLVAADAIVGTIGGGHLELTAIRDACSLLRGEAVARQRSFALGPSLGQCCGGAVEIGLAPLADEDPASWPEPEPLFHLQLYGAGHVGQAIVQLLATLPCRVAWIDARDDQFPHQPLPAHVERIGAEPVEAEVATAPPGAFHLVLTHSHDLDLALVMAILARGDAGYVGLIGSKTKRARFEHRLRERGFAEAAIAGIVCPIGVPGIPGKAPEVIAVATVAQLLQRAGALREGVAPR
jgi:xanthine dehydrogenase accessory factor